MATFGVLDTVSRQLLLALTLPVLVLGAVILGRDDDASLVGRKVRDNVTPGLVVVNAQSGDEVFVGVGHEAKGAASAAAAHLEDVGSLDLVPRAAIGILPDGLFDGAEERSGVGVADAYGDRVTHSRGNSESLVALEAGRENTFDTTRE